MAQEEDLKTPIREKYALEASAYYSSARLWDDGIIKPEDTRKVIGLSLLVSSRAAATEKAAEKGAKYGVFRM